MDKAAGQGDKSGIRAAVGAAVGLGNALRFPSLCALYGGGFLLAYCISLALVCAPLLCAELYMGKSYSGLGCAFSRLAPKSLPLAVCAPLNCAIIALCYAPVTAKSGGLFLSFALSGSAVEAEGVFLVLCGAAACLFAFSILSKPGLLARTARAAVVCALGVFAALAVFCAARGGNLLRAFFFTPRELLDGGLWADALGQALLALSLAGGVMPSFARSLPRGYGVRKGAAAIIAANLCGCVLSSACALSFPLPVPGEGGIALALSLYPQVIARAFVHFAAYRLFGALFFFTLALVAVQSTCSLLLPAVQLCKNRAAASAFFCALCVILLPVLAMGGGEIMKAADRTACTVNAAIIAFSESLVFATPRNMRRLKDECGLMICLMTAFFCPLAFAALAALAVCGARFAVFSPIARLCAFFSFAAVFSPYFVGFCRNMYNRCKSHKIL